MERNRVRVKIDRGSVCVERECTERERERDEKCVQREGRSVF